MLDSDQRFSQRYEPDTHEVKSARDFVGRVLTGEEWPEDAVHAAKLVVSELASNAVVHAQTPFEVACVLCPGPAAVVEITDHSPETHAEIRPPGSGRPGGLGLRLVASLSDEWGVRQQDSAKVVWCRLVADQLVQQHRL